MRLVMSREVRKRVRYAILFSIVMSCRRPRGRETRLSEFSHKKRTPHVVIFGPMALHHRSEDIVKTIIQLTHGDSVPFI